ncbi:zinc transporter ZIP10-like isoform X2 [Ostrea edulis]|uniref:zinc transporter ZIP10-like isoform X2 n=1 Tax=Ostrea edulis TaxID=37623 RepID=UPI0024AF6A4F|nr:zinc transporter ZIP10-like isoform X2 [Ostrea edulis]
MYTRIQKLAVVTCISIVCLCHAGDLEHLSDIEEMFINRLFKKYGNETAMTFEAFEHLFQNLEIGDMQFTHHINDHIKNMDFVPLHPDHKHERHKLKTTTENHRHRRNKETFSECLFPVDVVKLFGFNTRDVITADQFHHMCPALVVQLDSGVCPHAHAQYDQHMTENIRGMEDLARIPSEVWGYGSASISVISVLGLLAVSAIPCLQKVFLNTVLQFLVALAVGALTGDAMLHLLPHALSIKSEESDGGREEVYKGLCGLAGIYCFFIFGRLQGIYMNRKIEDKGEEKKENYLDISLTIDSKEQDLESIALNSAESKQTDKQYQTSRQDYKLPEETDHGHSHDHPVPRTVGALVWRVIVGDGIHNFSDGIAVGVAFASSITGGLSTSVAVLCHELPHEMGDFAVLLKNGMTIKQAVLYNCLSSLLSFIGMLVGLAVGNIGNSSPWIFAGIAGMFLHISLVDLLPEMSLLDLENRGKRPICQLFFQLGGILVGVGIMLLIAIYEHQLKSLFNG